MPPAPSLLEPARGPEPLPSPSSLNIARRTSNDLLPPEILQHIISFTTRNVQSRLMYTSQQLYEITAPILYRVVTLTWNMGPTVLDGLLELGNDFIPASQKRKEDLLKLVRVVYVLEHRHEMDEWDDTFSWDNTFKYPFPNLDTVVYRDIYACVLHNNMEQCPLIGHSRPRQTIKHGVVEIEDRFNIDPMFSKSIIIRRSTGKVTNDTDVPIRFWTSVLYFEPHLREVACFVHNNRIRDTWYAITRNAKFHSANEVVGIERFFQHPPLWMKQVDGQRIDTLSETLRSSFTSSMDPFIQDISDFDAMMGLDRLRSEIEAELCALTFTSRKTYMDRQNDPLVLREITPSMIYDICEVDD